METLVSLEDLIARLPFVMDADDEREAQGALDDLSDDARNYGRRSWDTADRAPREVKNLILRAAVRHMKNYEGYVQSRAGDETLIWTDRGHDAGSAYFTVREIRVLHEIAGNSTFISAEATAWGPVRRNQSAGLVPVGDGEKPFPYFDPADDGR